MPQQRRPPLAAQPPMVRRNSSPARERQENGRPAPRGGAAPRAGQRSPGNSGDPSRASRDLSRQPVAKRGGGGGGGGGGGRLAAAARGGSPRTPSPREASPPGEVASPPREIALDALPDDLSIFRSSYKIAAGDGAEPPSTPHAAPHSTPPPLPLPRHAHAPPRSPHERPLPRHTTTPPATAMDRAAADRAAAAAAGSSPQGPTTPPQRPLPEAARRRPSFDEAAHAPESSRDLPEIFDYRQLVWTDEGRKLPAGANVTKLESHLSDQQFLEARCARHPQNPTPLTLPFSPLKLSSSWPCNTPSPLSLADARHGSLRVLQIGRRGANACEARGRAFLTRAPFTPALHGLYHPYAKTTKNRAVTCVSVLFTVLVLE